MTTENDSQTPFLVIEKDLGSAVDPATPTGARGNSHAEQVTLKNELHEIITFVGPQTIEPARRAVADLYHRNLQRNCLTAIAQGQDKRLANIESTLTSRPTNDKQYKVAQNTSEVSWAGISTLSHHKHVQTVTASPATHAECDYTGPHRDQDTH
ncbi:hypothetical protein BDZ45DRAFT_798938 [Acephala macrosclerotiorum]|nr:hypothetical protein BDZ45DRAFT_798938 [Acephala macrosclerotiorum]